MRVEDRVNPVNPEMVDDAVHSSVPLSVASARFGSGKGLSQEDMISFGFSAPSLAADRGRTANHGQDATPHLRDLWRSLVRLERGLDQ
jgi:hypothetical protein